MLSESDKDDYSINSPDVKKKKADDNDKISQGRSTYNEQYGFYQNQDKIIERNISSEDSFMSEHELTDVEQRSTIMSNYEFHNYNS